MNTSWPENKCKPSDTTTAKRIRPIILDNMKLKQWLTNTNECLRNLEERRSRRRTNEKDLEDDAQPANHLSPIRPGRSGKLLTVTEVMTSVWCIGALNMKVVFGLGRRWSIVGVFASQADKTRKIMLNTFSQGSRYENVSVCKKETFHAPASHWESSKDGQITYQIKLIS